jgi:hypothetical protein
VKLLKGRDVKMKQVIIEMINGEPHVKSKPRKIEVLIKYPKKHGLKKRIKTVWYHVKSFLGLV